MSEPPPVEIYTPERKAEFLLANAVDAADRKAARTEACRLGLEGIVSKRLGSAYRSGRVGCWVKVKNPAALAVTREAKEDWNS